MKRNMTTRTLRVGLGNLSLTAVSGCDELIMSNLLLGARDGALTTTSGIINDFFDGRYGIEAGEDDHADEGDHGHEDEHGHEGDDGHGHEEGANDLFIRL